jgi:hypothetical protein
MTLWMTLVAGYWFATVTLTLALCSAAARGDRVGVEV